MIGLLTAVLISGVSSAPLPEFNLQSGGKAYQVAIPEFSGIDFVKSRQSRYTNACFDSGSQQYVLINQQFYLECGKCTCDRYGFWCVTMCPPYWDPTLDGCVETVDVGTECCPKKECRRWAPEPTSQPMLTKTAASDKPTVTSNELTSSADIATPSVPDTDRPVQTTESAEPTEPVQTTEAAELTEAVQTTESVEPTEAVQTTESAEPTEPVETTSEFTEIQPIDPTASAEPIEPLQTESSESTEDQSRSQQLHRPTDPVQKTESSEPTESTTQQNTESAPQTPTSPSAGNIDIELVTVQ